MILKYILLKRMYHAVLLLRTKPKTTKKIYIYIYIMLAIFIIHLHDHPLPHSPLCLCCHSLFVFFSPSSTFWLHCNSFLSTIHSWQETVQLRFRLFLSRLRILDLHIFFLCNFHLFRLWQICRHQLFFYLEPDSAAVLNVVFKVWVQCSGLLKKASDVIPL